MINVVVKTKHVNIKKNQCTKVLRRRGTVVEDEVWVTTTRTPKCQRVRSGLVRRPDLLAYIVRTGVTRRHRTGPADLR